MLDFGHSTFLLYDTFQLSIKEGTRGYSWACSASEGFCPSAIGHKGPNSLQISHALRLLLKENKTCMSVQSPAMLTELNALICPGIHYCSLGVKSGG